MAVGVKTNPINWIPVTNLGRAKEFYERVFAASLEDCGQLNAG